MAAPHGRIEPGQPLETAISARAWNRAQDAADVVFGVGGGMTGSPSGMVQAPFVLLQCRNDSGADVPRYGVLAIKSAQPLPIAPSSSGSDDATTQFLAQPVVCGGMPAADDLIIVVATHPIADGEVGPAAVSGVVQVKLHIKNASHGFARPKAGDTSRLETADAGYPVLWKPAETGEAKWALVCLCPQSQPNAVRLGKVSSQWSKGTTATVEWYSGDGTPREIEGEPETFEAINRFSSINPSAPVWVACALIDETWHLVAAEC